MLLVFLLLWILFNGKVNLEILLIGLTISLALYRFCCKHMGYNPKTDIKIIRYFSMGMVYIGILVTETVKANLKISKLVFARKIEIEPQIIFFKTNLKTPSARVVYANSITLIPGTITVALKDDLFCVHCINNQMAEDLTDSVLVRRLQKMEDIITT